LPSLSYHTKRPIYCPSMCVTVYQLSLWQAIASTVAAAAALIVVWELLNEWRLSKAKVDVRFLLRRNAGIVYTASDGIGADDLLGERHENKIRLRTGQTEVKLYFWMKNKGRVLRNPILWFTLPGEFKIYSFDSGKYNNVEWRREFKIQEWHNCAYFGFGHLPYLATRDVSMYPIIVDAPDTVGVYPVNIEIAAENRAKNYKRTLEIVVTSTSSKRM